MVEVTVSLAHVAANTMRKTERSGTSNRRTTRKNEGEDLGPAIEWTEA